MTSISREESDRRLLASNRVLHTYCKMAWIERRLSGFYVCWQQRDRDGSNARIITISRRWQCRGNDWYPVWANKYPGGGTSLIATSQLIRWCRGQPVLPISSWRGWAHRKVNLLPSHAVDELARSGYPLSVDCVLCGRSIVHPMDWWHLNGVSGPCCSHRNGCRQKIKTEEL